MTNPTTKDMAVLVQRERRELDVLLTAGQREYAHDGENVLANFDRRAKELNVAPETVLAIFAGKHWDGIAAWIKGHRSQREDVRGRINDLHVYLTLLRAIVERYDGKFADASFSEPVVRS